MANVPARAEKDLNHGRDDSRVLVHLAYRFRIYPTRVQASLLSKTFGSTRFIWNTMLEERKTWYAEHGASIGKARKTEKECKVIHLFLKNVDSIVLQQARIDLDKAYDNFFKKRANFPRFKSRRGKQSYRTVAVGSNVRVDFAARRLKLPKLGGVTCRDGRTFTERPQRVTVSKIKSGRYFASIGIEGDIPVVEATTVREERVAGFDMGARDIITGVSSRETNPRFYRSEENRLKRLHRRMSRKVKASRNRDKARVKLARLYDRIGNRRDDWLHKLFTSLATRFDAVVIEDLNVEGMKRWNGGFAKIATLDTAWGTFTRMLEYKMVWRGKHFVKVDRFYPSSQLSSVYGHQYQELTLDERAWTCPACGIQHDRDINAATNITREGITLLREKDITVISNDATAGTAGSRARGDRIRPATPAAPIAEPGIPSL